MWENILHIEDIMKKSLKHNESYQLLTEQVSISEESFSANLLEYQSIKSKMTPPLNDPLTSKIEPQTHNSSAVAA